MCDCVFSITCADAGCCLCCNCSTKCKRYVQLNDNATSVNKTKSETKQKKTWETEWCIVIEHLHQFPFYWHSSTSSSAVKGQCKEFQMIVFRRDRSSLVSEYDVQKMKWNRKSMFFSGFGFATSFFGMLIFSNFDEIASKKWRIPCMNINRRAHYATFAFRIRTRNILLLAVDYVSSMNSFDKLEKRRRCSL